MKGERRLARELALQALYEIDLAQHPPSQVMFEQFGALENPIPVLRNMPGHWWWGL